MSTYHILVVDDDPGQLEMLDTFLSAQGFVVETANNGLEGLQRCNELRPDLVITDNSMPEMTGLELLHAIHNHADLSTTKIIMVSGDLHGTATRAATAGVNVFLPKPYSLMDLLRIITSLLA